MDKKEFRVLMTHYFWWKTLLLIPKSDIEHKVTTPDKATIRKWFTKFRIGDMSSEYMSNGYSERSKEVVLFIIWLIETWLCTSIWDGGWIGSHLSGLHVRKRSRSIEQTQQLANLLQKWYQKIQRSLNRCIIGNNKIEFCQKTVFFLMIRTFQPAWEYV